MNARLNSKIEMEFGGINKGACGKEKAGFSVEGIINGKDWD